LKSPPPIEVIEAIKQIKEGSISQESLSTAIEAANQAGLPETAKKLEQLAAPEIVKTAVEAADKGTATPALLSPAIDAANKAGLPATAEKLAASMETLVTLTIPAIVSAPDRASTPVPLDPTTGKTLWYPETRNGIRLIMPRFRSVLIQFAELQRIVGVKDDGRIGPGTLAAFKAKTGGFSKAPRTIESLAANAVKWTEILKKGYAPEVVGAIPFDSAGPFIALTEALVPKVEEKLGGWVGKEVNGKTITLSGLLGISSTAGIRGAAKWLESASDRERFPGTTKAFESTNGLF
jgi:hypothetical protein